MPNEPRRDSTVLGRVHQHITHGPVGRISISFGEMLMLELRPNCECCNKDLPPDSAEAMICTYECTFCRDCVQSRLHGICPNCGGNLVVRPIRPASKLQEGRRA